MKIFGIEKKEHSANELTSYRANRLRGFTLLELLIYVSIFGIIVFVVASMLVTILGGKDATDARIEVSQNVRFASEKIRQLMYDAATSTVTGACPSNTLEVNIAGVTTTVALANGALETTSQGVVNAITSNLVTATSEGATCIFTRVANTPPASPTLQLRFKIQYNNNGNPHTSFSESVRTTMSQR